MLPTNVAMQQLGKHVSSEMNAHTSIKELFELNVFYVLLVVLNAQGVVIESRQLVLPGTSCILCEYEGLDSSGNI
jgi:hypothetical protein